MNYRDLIKEAFWITLRNRFLWFFRFFISGGIGSSNFNPSTGGPGNFNGGLGYASPTWLSEPTRWIGMMLRRSEDLSVVEGEHARRLWRNLARRGWKLNEPLDDQLPIRERVQTRAQIREALPYAMSDIRIGGLACPLPRREACPDQPENLQEQALP